MKRSYLLAVITCFSLSCPLLGQDLFVKGGKVVDPTTRQIEDANLLIVDGRIAGRPSDVPEDFSGEVIEASGRWVIPGLNDLHTHSYGNMAPGNTFEFVGVPGVARRYLYCGVTGFMDLFGDEDVLYGLREQQGTGISIGAELFASLSCLTATEGHCTEYGVKTRTMDNPEEARMVVVDLAKRRPDVVKIVYAPRGRMPSIDKETLAAAVATANEHGLKTVIHVDTWQSATDAIEVGASALTHVPDDGPVPEYVIRAMVARNVAHIPTLAVETDFSHFVLDPDVLAHPLARNVTSEAILDAYATDATVAHAEERAAQRREHEAMILASVKTLADAGVTMLTGTDAGNYGTLQGYSIHRELQKMVAAGLTPWAALAAATTEAGSFLGQSWGVADGDEANLVILDASPIEDIRNTLQIHQVVHQGRLVDRDALLKAPATAEEPGSELEYGEGTKLSMRATGTFEVQLKPLEAYNQSPAAQIGRMSIDKTFEGELAANSQGEMLSGGSPASGSAGYVAIERVTGVLQGKSGSFLLQHSATMTPEAQEAKITVVPGSGTAELEGIGGEMGIEIESGQHSYWFEYELPAE